MIFMVDFSFVFLSLLVFHFARSFNERPKKNILYFENFCKQSQNDILHLNGNTIREGASRSTSDTELKSRNIFNDSRLSHYSVHLTNSTCT